MKKILSLFTAILITIAVTACSQSATQNEQLAGRGVDFTYWLKIEDNNTNQPLVEFGNSCIITIDADANSAEDVVKRLDALQLTETDVDLSRYTNSVFIHRIALNTFEDRSADVHYNFAGHKYAYQFWFYDDFKYMKVTDGEEVQLGSVLEVVDNTDIKQLYTEEAGHYYITPQQFERVEKYLNTYIIGRGKAEIEELTKEQSWKIDFPEDFVFNIDYSRLNVAVFNNEISMITGWMEYGGEEYSFNMFVDTDEAGNLIPDKIYVYEWYESDV